MGDDEDDDGLMFVLYWDKLGGTLGDTDSPPASGT